MNELAAVELVGFNIKCILFFFSFFVSVPVFISTLLLWLIDVADLYGLKDYTSVVFFQIYLGAQNCASRVALRL